MVAAVHKTGWRHLPYFAHTLNLVVKDSLKAVPEVVQVLEKCSALVPFFHHGTKAAEKWWQEHEQTFSALSRLALRYLGIVASSVPAERMFQRQERL